MRIFFPIKSQIVIDRVRVEGWGRGVLNTDLSNISIFNLAEGWRVRDEMWGVRGKGRGTGERGRGWALQTILNLCSPDKELAKTPSQSSLIYSQSHLWYSSKNVWEKKFKKSPQKYYKKDIPARTARCSCQPLDKYNP
jgi:hypothetical protein